MKRLKTKAIYKASNVVFDADNMKAFSYDWWQFVGRLEDGTILFNEHNYSVTTGAHQRKVRYVMDELGIEYITYNSRTGLQEGVHTSLLHAQDELDYEIDKLNEAISKPRSRKSTNENRRDRIAQLREEKDRIENLQLRVEGYSDQDFDYLEANQAYNRQVAEITEENTSRQDDKIIYLSSYR